MDPNDPFIQMLNNLNQNGFDFSQIRLQPQQVQEIQNGVVNGIGSLGSIASSFAMILKFIDQKCLFTLRRLVIVSDFLFFVFLTIASILAALFFEQCYSYFSERSIWFWSFCFIIYHVISRLISGKHYYRITIEFFLDSFKVLAYVFAGFFPGMNDQTLFRQRR